MCVIKVHSSAFWYYMSFGVVCDYIHLLKTTKGKSMKIKALVFFTASVILAACDDSENPFAYQKNAHGRGTTEIFVDESFKPLMETSIDVFESQYPKANIVAKYKTEGDIIQDFYDDKVKTICISRDFTKKEKDELVKLQMQVRSDMIALDGVALIINMENMDSMITVPRLKEILTSKKQTWKTSGEEIKVVFDNKFSSNFNFILDSLHLRNHGKLSPNAFAAHSNKEVIEYVKSHKNAMGIIGLNWISDQDDFEVMNFLDGIRVMNVSRTEDGEYLKPYQGYIFTKEYPLTRSIWMINKAGKSTVNSGFIIFLTGEKGQLIVQKSELVPARSPVRLIQINQE